jgi:hypothetical protein
MKQKLVMIIQITFANYTPKLACRFNSCAYRKYLQYYGVNCIGTLHWVNCRKQRKQEQRS